LIKEQTMGLNVRGVWGRLTGVLGIVGGALAMQPAGAQAVYPSRPVTLVVPFAAGGAFDVVARLAAQHAARALGQPVVVENKPGAGGTVGGKQVAQARPDGYTVLLSGVGPISIAPAVFKNLGYSPSKALAPVVQLTASPFVLVAAPQTGADSVQALVAQLKAQPGRFNYASTGNGTLVHLAGEYFKLQTGVQATHVPFAGGSQATNSLLAGDTQFSITNIPNVRAQVDAGKLRALATTGRKRSSAFPDLPTLEEAGIRPFDLQGWIGLFVPAATPGDVVHKLNAAFASAMQDPQIRQQLVAQGDEVVTGTPAEFAAFVARSDQQWQEIATRAKVSID
jgi:tripartite-type tricarboxylate transporter receptor subunit TctC